MKKYTLAVFGCGKLADIVVDAVNAGMLPDYQLVGAFSRTVEKAERLRARIADDEHRALCKPCKTSDEVLALNADYIVELASPSAMKALAVPALKGGSSIICLSIGALADQAFYDEAASAAVQGGSRVHIASGAIGGFDVLQTVALMGDCEVSFATEKGPNSLQGTPVYDEKLQQEKRRVFEGNAEEAIALFPTKVNVAVAASLASVGPVRTKASVTSIPGYVGDEHKIHINSDQVDAHINVYSKTSQIAGWSVVRTLRNIVSPIVF